MTEEEQEQEEQEQEEQEEQEEQVVWQIAVFSNAL